MHLIFDKNMLKHINDSRMSEVGSVSATMLFAERLLNVRFFVFLLWCIERALSFLLTLPLPIYSAVVYMWITQARGLPHITGMYLRGLYYSRILKRLDSNVFIDQGVFFAHPQDVELAEFSYIDKGVIVMASSVKVGRRVHIAPKVFISGGGNLEVEDYACIATNTSVITSTEVLKNGARCSGPMASADQRQVKRGSVKIEKDAFVGPHVVILPNVVVATGSVVAAGSVLPKSTEPWGIYAVSAGRRIADRDPVRHADN